ncbi:hypothetical protein [Roseivivax sp. CAU 1761]
MIVTQGVPARPGPVPGLLPLPPDPAFPAAVAAAPETGFSGRSADVLGLPPGTEEPADAPPEPGAPDARRGGPAADFFAEDHVAPPSVLQLRIAAILAREVTADPGARPEDGRPDGAAAAEAYEAAAEALRA